MNMQSKYTGIIIIIVIVVVGIGVYYFVNDNSNTNENLNQNTNLNTNSGTVNTNQINQQQQANNSNTNVTTNLNANLNTNLNTNSGTVNINQASNQQQQTSNSNTNDNTNLNTDLNANLNTNSGTVNTDQASCQQLENEINTLIDTVQYCEQDSDCFDDNSLNLDCPFGCYFVRSRQFNDSEHMSLLSEKIEQYTGAVCSECVYKCTAPPEPTEIKCQNNKCIIDRQDTPDQNTSDEQVILRVKFEIDAPFSDAVVIIMSDGEIHYQVTTTSESVNEAGSIEITDEQFTQLANLINTNNFWSFSESYIDHSLLDGTYNTVTVMSYPASADPTLVDPGIYSVTCYATCPEGVSEIVNKIRELWGRDIL